MRRSTPIGKRTPSAFADRLRLEHHRPRERPRAVVGDDVLERAAGQRRDRVEGQIAPELQPDLAADVVAHRRLQAGRDHLLGKPRDALALLARRLAQRKALAVDVADQARRFDLGGGIDHAADDALRPEPVPDRAAGIDRLQPRAFQRPADAVKIPPGHAVLHGDDGRVLAEQRRDLIQRRPDRMGLQRQHDIVLHAELVRLRGGPDRNGGLLAVLDQPSPFASHRRRDARRARRSTGRPGRPRQASPRR